MNFLEIKKLEKLFHQKFLENFLISRVKILRIVEKFPSNISLQFFSISDFKSFRRPRTKILHSNPFSSEACDIFEDSQSSNRFSGFPIYFRDFVNTENFPPAALLKLFKDFWVVKRFFSIWFLIDLISRVWVRKLNY